MSDIFEEVEESLRQDKATQLWKRFGPFVWAIGILIIAAVGYREWSINQQSEVDEARVIEFEAARAKLADGEYAEAQAELQTLVDNDTKISPVAANLLARTYYEGNGDAEAAAATLENVAGIDGPIERLALLKAAYLRADSMNLSELEAFLGALPGESTALGVLALELIAAKALKEGDLARARQEFSYLRFAPNVPPGVLQRAEIALSVIPDPDPAPAEDATPVEADDAEPEAGEAIEDETSVDAEQETEE